ncbi:hypothetical protein AYK26_05655 [Euryarchaeota archaeon SM23-78]|nr:MAG: hypothetical protein AYK26_05655 [Euryarchaeota archaeon SM23-78]MBW3001369.1 hypothetical protein [Candidatus Woesearchaeota archaeon]
MKSLEVLYLDQSDLIKAGLLDFKMVLSEIEKGLIWHASNESLSDKIVIELDPIQDWKINSLIAINGDYSANKWLGSNLIKTEDLPRTIATITLNDKNNGHPLCIMDGTLISAIRTGAYAALGLKYLAQEKNNIGIIGSGVMAKSSLLLMTSNLAERINDIFVYSRHPKNYKAFAKQMTEKTGMKVTPISDVSKLVRYSDVTVSAITKNDEILVKNKDVKRGSTHIHIGGWDDEEQYLISCAKEGKIICDDWNLIKKRNAHPLPLAHNKGIILDRDIYAELGQIILGEKKGREANENIYFDTVGIGEMDLVLAIKIYEKAVQRGIGKRLKIWDSAHWILEGYK